MQCLFIYNEYTILSFWRNDNACQAKDYEKGKFQFRLLKNTCFIAEWNFCSMIETNILVLDEFAIFKKNDMRKNYELQYTSKILSENTILYDTSAVKESLFFCWCRDRNRYRKNANQLRRVPLHLTRHLKSHTAHWQLSREEKSQCYIYIIIVNRKKGGITYLSCDANREQDRYLCVWFLTVVNCIILCQNIQLARPIKRGFQALFRFQFKDIDSLVTKVSHWNISHWEVVT